MHVILTVLAILFVIGGFVGLFLGVIPSLVLWTLAALCIYGGWRMRPDSVRRREEHFSGPPAA